MSKALARRGFAGILPLSLCCICIFLAMSVQPLLGETPAPTGEDQPDNEEPWPEKMGTRETWEKIVYFPGAVIYFPLQMIFKATKATIAFVTGKKLIARTKDLVTSDDGRRGLRVKYANSIGGGPKFFQKGLISPESKLTTSATIGLKKQHQFRVKMRRMNMFDDFISSDYILRYRKLTEESYFGMGPDSEKENESKFSHGQVTAEATFRMKLAGRVLLDTVLGFDINNISDSTIEENLVGLDEEVKMGRFQAGVRYDFKNTQGNPSNVSEALLAAGLFQNFGDGDFSFWRASANMTYCFHLFYGRVLALRMRAQMTEPFSDQSIPFYYLSEIGRVESIRGFATSRFRDRDMLSASLEYRYPIWRKVDTVLFVDVGQVAHDIFSDISQDDLSFGYGIGFRLHNDEELVSSFMIGRSKDGFRFYFGLD